MKIALIHSVAALFGQHNLEDLSKEERQTLTVIKMIVDNRVKLESYPPIDDCPDHFRLYCIKRSFDPATQQAVEMRLFLLLQMQTNRAVVVSYDAVKANQHSWNYHKKKIEYALLCYAECAERAHTTHCYTTLLRSGT